jgi:uncharacterized membrane protein
MTTATPARPSERLLFLDGLRGLALILMIVNHTLRWWIDVHMTWTRYHLIYLTLTVAAPTFLFLVGFCLPLSLGAAGTAPTFGTLVRKYVGRGARIVLAGLLLNALAFPHDPILSGGVLQTIGLGIMVMGPVMWLLRFPAARPALLLAAAAAYVAFSLAHPALGGFVERHRTLGLILFFDFPPWPWLSLILVGLVLGWSWLYAHRRGAGARWLAVAAAVGVGLIVAWAAIDWWVQTPLRFGMRRDFILNRHWTARGFSVLWVLGIVLLGPATLYWIMEVRRWRLRWLVLLGQTALALYFIHHFLVLTLVNQRLGWRLNDWPTFWLANAMLMLALLGIGRGWLEVRRGIAALKQRFPLLPVRART